MNRRLTQLSVSGAIVLLVAFSVVRAQEQRQQAQPAVDASCDAMLKQMCAGLSAAKTFTFDSHAIADQVLPSGQKVQFARNQKVAVRRPDKISATVMGDTEDLRFFCDGKQVTLLNPRANVYATTEAKGTIDETLDMLATQYGMAIPLADVVFADPYKSLMERVRSGQDLGSGYVFETKCRHLAFRQDTVDWQIWIEEGDKPLPRKIVITYKEQPGHPQYTAFLSNWNLAADVPDSAFTFTPPQGATKTEFAAPAPATQPSGRER